MKICILLIGSLFITTVLTDPTLISKSFQGNDFNDPDGWSVLNAKPAFNVCSDRRMFGGWTSFGKQAVTLKQFEFPSHSTVYIKLTFFKIAIWNADLFQVWLDDELVHKQHNQVGQGTNLCGRGFLDFQQQISIKAKHTGPTGIVVITSSLDLPADKGSWGIRDFEIAVEKCPDGCDACQEGDSAEACKVWVSDQNFWGTFITDKLGAEGWTVTGGQGTPSNCGGIALFGGFQRFGAGASIQRTLKIKPHYRLKIKLLFTKIDSWDNEVAVLKLDGTELWKRAFKYNEGYWSNICGTGNFEWRELFTRVEADVAHTGDQATVLITSTLDEAPINESWGVRDFYLFYAACSPNCGKCTGPLPKDCTCIILFNKECSNNWVMQNGNCAPLANFVLLESSFWDDKFSSLDDWVLAKNMGGNLIYDCNGKTLVGGYKSLGAGATATKKFSLPQHKRLRLIVTMYKIDSWDNEWLIIKFDGLEVWKRQYNIQTGGANFCGWGIFNDYIEQVDEIVVHTQPQLEIQMSSTLDQGADDESWGFREFKLFYEPKEECAIFYTECDFKGAAYDFCSKSPNFQKDNIPPVIRSIKIPPQAKVTLYESADYNGKKVIYTTSQRCINSFEFSFAQQSGHIEQELRWIEVSKSKLRGNM